MTLPTVHLNGTHPDDLHAQQLAVSTCARALLVALREASPNGRDYYPQGPTAFAAAQNEFDVLWASVQRVLGVANAQLEHVADTRGKR